MGDANDEELARRRLEEVRRENEDRTREQQAALAKYREDQAKAAEEAAKKGNMVADPEPAARSWPDDGYQATPQSGVDKVAGALRVGQAGDLAFARDLLNSGQAPLGGVSKPEGIAAGAQESGAGSRAAKPALGLG